MKRKTSQKTRLSCQTDVLHIKRKRKRSRPAVVLLGTTSSIARACSLIILRSLLSLSGVYYFCSSSYLVKFLGTLTRVVRLATRP